MRMGGVVGVAWALLGWTGCASVPGTSPEPGAEPEEAGACVAQIAFVGNERLADRDLEAELFTTKASFLPWADCVPYDEVTFEADVDRIRERYREEGFFAAEVAARVIRSEPEEIELEVTVVEGAPVLLQTREVALLPGSLLQRDELDAMLSGLPARTGEPFGRLVYDRSREALLEALGALGHLEPTLTGGADVDLDTNTAALAWELAPGPRVRVGDITVEGPDSIDERLLVYRLPLESGEVLTPAKLRDAQRAMADIGIFRSVRIVPDRLPANGAEATWPIRVTLEPGALRRIRLGAGYGTDEGPRGLASWSHRNWLGGLRRLRLSLKVSRTEQFARLSLLQPSFPDLATDLELRLGYGEEDPPAWRSLRATGAVELERPLAPGWKGAMGLRLSDDHLRQAPFDPAVFDEDEDPTVGAFTTALRHDALDDITNPTSGYALSLEADLASRALLSDTDFLKLVGRVRGFVPLGSVVLAGRIATGAIAPFGGTGQEDIPVVERFFAGGSVSVRGYGYQQLPPDDLDADPIGGLTWLEGSVELRVPLWRELQGVVFVDAGVIDVASWTIDFDDVLYAAGVGARYVTPIGPLRLDVGFPLNRPPGFNSFRFHVSVGRDF